MSILGYSSSYFLPEYWANTPLYGEKIIPLLDYMLSTEYENSESLAQAFYDIENKYKNQAELPIEVVETIIDENGYSYVKDLLGNNEENIRLLLSLMVLVHQLKGTKLGIMTVLNLLRRDNNIITLGVIGNPKVNEVTKEISDFTVNDYATLSGFNATGDSVSIDLKFSGFTLGSEQCIMSVPTYGIYIGIDPNGYLVLSLGSSKINWNITERQLSSRALSVGNLYYLQFQYDGYEYSLKISTDGKNYEKWISVESNESLNIENGVIYLGVDNAEGHLKNPFTGFINYSNFSIGTANLEIEQWFEQNPVGHENTFIIKTDLEADLIGLDFFSNFSNFIRNYVYPSLEAFIATLKFRSILAFVPYVRSHITFIAFMDTMVREHFLVKENEESEEATDPYIVGISAAVPEGEHFMVIKSN